MKLFKSDIEYVKGLSYTQIIDLYLTTYKIKIVKYYNSYTGSAFLDRREIEIPYITDDESFIVAFHEIAHILNAPLFESFPPYKFEYWTEMWAIKEAKKWNVVSSKYEREASKYIKSYVDEVIANGIDTKKIPLYIKKFCKIT